MGNQEMSLFDVAHVLQRRGAFVIACAVVFVGISILRSLISCPVYRAGAVVALPTMPNTVFVERISETGFTIAGNQLVNVADTRELLGALADDEYAALVPLIEDPASIADTLDVRVDEIYGTDKLFRMYVRVKNRPRSAVVLMEAMLKYLQQHPMVIAQLDMKEAGHTKSYALPRQSHPAIRLPGLADKPRTSSDDAHLSPTSFQFLRKPTVSLTPIRPRPLRDGILMGIVGLLFGATVALIYEILAARGKSREPDAGASA